MSKILKLVTLLLLSVLLLKEAAQLLLRLRLNSQVRSHLLKSLKMVLLDNMLNFMLLMLNLLVVLLHSI